MKKEYLRLAEMKIFLLSKRMKYREYDLDQDGQRRKGAKTKLSIGGITLQNKLKIYKETNKMECHTR